MGTITDLLIKYDGAKCGFERYYDILFKEFQDKEFNLFEIGIFKGNSMYMWQDYFSKANIYAIDIFENFALKYFGERVKTFAVAQDNKERLTNLVDEIGTFDIIIDDGGHQLPLQTASFEVLGKYVNKGGLYCIEDVFDTHSKKLVEVLNKDNSFKWELRAHGIKDDVELFVLRKL